MVRQENRSKSDPYTASGPGGSSSYKTEKKPLGSGMDSGDISRDGAKIPQDSPATATAKNCLIVSGPIRKVGQGESETYDVRSFDNTRDFDSPEDRKATIRQFSRSESRLMTYFKILGCLLTSLAMFVALISTGSYSDSSSYRIFNISVNDVVFGVAVPIVTVIFLLTSNALPKHSKRVIKWTLEEFSEEREYFFTSPSIRDLSGFWRIVLRQTSEEETTFGLIATDITKNIYNVAASVEISVTIGGFDIIPGLNDIKFVHCYECEGDCGYSAPIHIGLDQLKNSKMYIKCQIQFSRKEIPNYQKVLNYLALMFGPDERMHQRYYGFGSGCGNEKSFRPVEIGSITPEHKFCTRSENVTLDQAVLTGTELEGDIPTFMKHPQTRTFFWKISNFSRHLKNVECWSVFSPNLFVNSHGFCSIWRLQLVELQGIFRLHLQLRGLPTGISQIKLRHLAELTDNFGDFIVPKHFGSSIKYPDHLRLWDTHRSSLYRRETILERFVTIEDVLTIRVSLHCEPNDLVKIETESTSAGDWILHN